MTKKKNLYFSLAMATAIISGLASCKKDGQKEDADRSVSAGATVLAPCATPGSLGDSTITGVITTNKFLQSGKIYRLNGLVYVANNATLTIEAGTRIVGLPGTGTRPGGGLVITRGAKIIANGLPQCPIVFTSSRPTPAPGDWSGVIILGRAPVNKANPLIEGVPDNPPADANYGGTICNDNSGILRYVRIEYAGYTLSANNEINGLTLGGVGCGTTIDYVEVYKANDDAFEFFGGTVNPTHLVAVDPLDDMFDFDFGYQGHIQYALGLADQTRADISVSNGIESDNDNVNGGSTQSPQTRPVISNMTLIGYADSVRANGANRGVGNHWRRNSGFMLQNSIVMGFRTGLFLDGCPTQTKYLGTGAARVDSLKKNLVHAYNTGSVYQTGGTGSCFTSLQFQTKALSNPAGCDVEGNTAYRAANANASIRLRNPFNRAIAGFYQPLTNPNPALASPAITGYTTCGLPGLPNCCNFTFVGAANSFRGAFGPAAAQNWGAGWTRF